LINIYPNNADFVVRLLWKTKNQH